MSDLLNSSPRLMEVGDFAVFAEGLDHPECVACGPRGEIYAGGEAGQVYRVAFDGTVEQVATTGGFLLGLCSDRDSNIYACDVSARAVLRVSPDGSAAVYADGSPGRKMQTPNHLVFDDVGNLYVSDSGRWHGRDGCLFLVRPDGTVVVASDELPAFPNGLALHPDGRALFVVLSQQPGVVRLKVRADGSLGLPEPVVDLPRCVPDGLTFDEDGNLYISCFTPDVVFRLSAKGEITVLVEDWESTAISSPTNLAFCGADRRTLVLANFGGWHLTMAPMAIAGAPLRYPLLR